MPCCLAYAVCGKRFTLPIRVRLSRVGISEISLLSWLCFFSICGWLVNCLEYIKIQSLLNPPIKLQWSKSSIARASDPMGIPVLLRGLFRKFSFQKAWSM